MRNDKHHSARPMRLLLQAGLFSGLGIAVAHWFFDNAVAGAVLGLATYLVFVLGIMVGDIAAIHRELAAFRKGEESD